MKEPAVLEHFHKAIDHLCLLFEAKPQVIASDLHPDYFSTQYAMEKMEAELVQVQHHHAHIVSCMVEHQLFDRVIGISADGVGLGTDKNIWGCEVMIADRADFERVCHLEYFAMPGGDAAARQTFRPAMGLLYNAFGGEIEEHPIAAKICPDSQTRKMILEMIQRKINSPLCSSLGRLFDAVACMIGVASMNHFEGEAPMLLEALANLRSKEEYPFEIKENIISIKPMIRQIVADVESKVETNIIADRFHNTVSAFLARAAIMNSQKYGIGDVVFSGGCFANRNISRQLSERLTAAGLRVFQHQRVPCNDGGIALGQAAVAAARIKMNFEHRTLNFEL